MELKDTLLMPKTDFEMRGNLPKKEPLFLEEWAKEDLYNKMIEARKGNTPFVLHDGPPYANGNIHVGHALNKILKDFVVKSRAMMGYYTPFIPGWDTHGLPIENAIQKLGHNRKAMATSEFRKLCYDYALQQIEKQKSDFKRLGAFADYDHPYVTLHKEFEANQIKIFAKMAMDGLIYKGLKPVYWSPSSESALAEAEIEYHDIKSPTIYVAFKVVDGKGVLEGDESFVIWTTTPWTIPANLAICLNPDLEYAVCDTEKGKLIFLLELKEALQAEFKLEKCEVIKTFKGKELEFITAKHPFYDKTSLVILGDHVTSDAGTGCVHTAPGHGVDDFNVGMKYGLEAYCPVDEKGLLMASAGEFLEGQFVDDANKTVVAKLEELGALLSFKWITHSYPHDWRTKKPIVFRATTQWFASIDKIREKLLKEIETINWYPKWGEQRLYNMIRDRGDWCISRQRVWGLPIPIFYGEDGTPIIDQEVFSHVEALIREHGSNVWFEREAKDLLPEGYTHPSSPNGNFKKETDIMDVWFDSGSSHTGCLVERGITYPADLYLEGSDQYRGWFNSSLIIGTAYHGKAPYKNVVSHGFIIDKTGAKMSKSSGNGVDPIKVMNTYGADILRLWVGSVDYQSDAIISDDILKQIADSYRKIRNTFKFALGNINPSDFDYQKDMVAYEDLEYIDKYVLNVLNNEVAACREAYNEYDFVTVTSRLLAFISTTFSSFYMDYSKDILYILDKEDKRRRQVQSVIYTCVDTLATLLAPILSFTCEEVHKNYAHVEGSIFLRDMADVKTYADAEEVLEAFKRLNEVRDEVNKAIELVRNEKIIGKSLEAKVELSLDADTKALVEKYIGENLKQWLIVSDAVITDEELEKVETIGVRVTKCDGIVCNRCWNIVPSVDDNCVCPRCSSVLKKIGYKKD
ncbi:MAG: isoleucine--tRNA ligase [Erysipelotrichaceae bacterium]|nr:isoleucine--tRNA ligase [Erysipelotrichaceae bacterium]